jgi:hypothetical protein
MGDLTDEFFEMCADEFQFLVDEFGCRKRAKKTDAGVYRVPYENGTTKVEIGLEWREQYIYVLLGRRDAKRAEERGRLPQPDDEITAFNLEDLLALRAPGEGVSPDSFGRALTREAIERILQTYARALREHGADVLQGDFKILPAVTKIMRQRMN